MGAHKFESHVYCPGSTVEIVCDARWAAPGVVVERIEGFAHLAWVRVPIFSFTRARDGYAITYTDSGASCFVPEQNVRDLTIAPWVL